MAIVTSWCDLADEVVLKFPEVNRDTVLAHQGDMGALMRQVAEAHGLTFAEAAEMVTFRLSHYVEPERLSA